MKALTLTLMLGISSILNARTIKSVESLWATNNGFKVTKIEYSQTSTVLSLQTTNDCGPTLKIGHGIYIVDDKGVHHHAISTDGIKLDSLYVVPKGEKRRFTINFTPVAEDNKALDLIVPDTTRNINFTSNILVVENLNHCLVGYKYNLRTNKVHCHDLLNTNLASSNYKTVNIDHISDIFVAE